MGCSGPQLRMNMIHDHPTKKMIRVPQFCFCMGFRLARVSGLSFEQRRWFLEQTFAGGADGLGHDQFGAEGHDKFLECCEVRRGRKLVGDGVGVHHVAGLESFFRSGGHVSCSCVFEITFSGKGVSRSPSPSPRKRTRAASSKGGFPHHFFRHTVWRLPPPRRLPRLLEDGVAGGDARIWSQHRLRKSACFWHPQRTALQVLPGFSSASDSAPARPPEPKPDPPPDALSPLAGAVPLQR